MVSLENIGRDVNGHKVLQDITLDLLPGQVSVIIGPSGAGKTSLLRVIGLLDRPHSGVWRLEDELYLFPTSEQIKGEKIYPKVTMVFQQLFLWPHLTNIENITFPLRLRKSFDAAARDLLERLTSELSLSEYLHRFPNESSVGQRQRVAMARAMLLQPKVILLDEVTASLDVRQVANLIRVIERLRQEGTSVLITTHSLDFAASVADRVLFLEKGRIIESGDRSILITPKTKQLSEFLGRV
jgi:arginine transport system ATP-binding protein